MTIIVLIYLFVSLSSSAPPPPYNSLIIGHYLTTRKEAATKRLVAAAVQSVPWNLVEGIRHIERPGLSLLFNQYLAYCLKGLVKIHRYQLEGDHPWDFEEVMKVRSSF